ncbi:protein c-Fos-like [Paramormyrops kingsleyae]|uniref:protein c-Fos-like n=1 Tax=Paramormyrops kingsleyae TaxID=1676925 RepID=UPI003B96BD41
MYLSSGLEYDSSRSSTASPSGDNLFQYSSSAVSYSNVGSPCQSQGINSKISFTPTITDISASSDMKWMLQPTTLISTMSPCNSRGSPYNVRGSNIPQSRTGTIKRTDSKNYNTGRRGRNEQLSSEEEQKRRVRRERNKLAAAKCRNRRREITDTLQAETDSLEDEKSALQNEIASLLKQKERLELILLVHKPICKIPSEKDSESPMESVSSHLSIQHPTAHPSGSKLEVPATFSRKTSVFGTSHALGNETASTVQMSDLDASLEESLDLLESLRATSVETSQSVPDIDLSTSLYTQDWEPLYTPATGDSGPLCTPVVTCTPTCATYTSSFSFAYPEADLLDSCRVAHRKESSSNEPSSDPLGSPTLLAL